MEMRSSNYNGNTTTAKETRGENGEKRRGRGAARKGEWFKTLCMNNKHKIQFTYLFIIL